MRNGSATPFYGGTYERPRRQSVDVRNLWENLSGSFDVQKAFTRSCVYPAHSVWRMWRAISEQGTTCRSPAKSSRSSKVIVSNVRARFHVLRFVYASYETPLPKSTRSY